MIADVCIPVYNEEKNIQNLIDSIYRQKLGVHTVRGIYVYDDCSTDKTSKILEKLSAKYKNLHTISGTKNSGKATGLNVLFSGTKSEIFIILDSDIILADKNTLSKLLDSFENDNSVGIANGWYSYSKSFRPLRYVLEFSSLLLKQIGKHNALFTNWGGMQALRRSAFTGLDLPPNIHRIDAYLYLIATRNGYNYRFAPSAIVHDTKDFKALNFRWFCKIQKRSRSTPELFETLLSTAEKRRFTVDSSFAAQSFIRTYFRHPLRGTIYATYKLAASIVNLFTAQKEHYLWRK